MNGYHVKIITATGTLVRNVIAKRSTDALRTVLNLSDIDGPFCIVVKPVESFIEDAPTTQPEAA